MMYHVIVMKFISTNPRPQIIISSPQSLPRILPRFRKVDQAAFYVDRWLVHKLTNSLAKIVPGLV